MDRTICLISRFQIPESAIHVPPHITLADPKFGIPRDVDLIIGNGQLCEIMFVGRHRLERATQSPKIASRWVFGGRISNCPRTESGLCNVITNWVSSCPNSGNWKVYRKVTLHLCKNQFLESVEYSSHFLHGRCAWTGRLARDGGEKISRSGAETREFAWTARPVRTIHAGL